MKNFPAKDIAGKKFGRLLVIERVASPDEYSRWLSAIVGEILWGAAIPYAMAEPLAAGAAAEKSRKLAGPDMGRRAAESGLLNTAVSQK